MADNDNDPYNDEYQFADLDAINPDPVDEEAPTETKTATRPEEEKPSTDKNKIKRNAIIAVGVVILIMVLIKVIGSFFSEKKSIDTASIPAVTPTAPPAPVQQSVVPQPQVPTPNVDTKAVNQKLTELESTQESMRTDVSSVNEQLSGVSKNMNDIIAKMTELNNVIASLSAKVEAQSHEIEQLTIRREAMKRVYHVPVKAPQYPKYYIQAVIPGRAWLIATNGATLTVREGTVIAGYGVVKLIDPYQGRVLTSSGQVIKFSQEDS